MSHAPRTVLHLTHQGDGAGSTQSIFNLGQELRRRGHRVLIGCRAESLLARLSREAGLETVPLDFTRLHPLAHRLREVMARERVDVVNSHATLDRRALTWLRWRRLLPPAFVVTRRTMPRTSPLEVSVVGLTADRTIAVSPAVGRALRRRGQAPARLRVVLNGIDLARMDVAPSVAETATARAVMGATDARPVVLVVSRRKDQDVLLRALARVEPPAVLACVGIAADAELAALAEALPARHRAVFVPFSERPLAFYGLATVAALPSRIEGLSQALLEAMAVGLPVVASAAGGNPDLIVPDVTGVLVPSLDAGRWADALNRLLADSAARARLGAAGRAHVRAELALPRVAARTEAVYEEALARRLLRGERPR